MFDPRPTFVIVDMPLPSPRERQSCWLQFCAAVLADVPMENVTVTYADDQEAITLSIVCTCPSRHRVTMTHWCTSEDEYYEFRLPDNSSILFPLEPHLGEI